MVSLEHKPDMTSGAFPVKACHSFLEETTPFDCNATMTDGLKTDSSLVME